MDDHTEETPTPKRPRKRRPNGRWTDPTTPLQAARFERRESGHQVVKAIRELCPGHAGQPCKIDVPKLSDYETGARQPGLTHIEVFCRYYQKSPEALGLIRWRDEPPTGTERSPEGPAANPDSAVHERDGDPDQERLVLDWLRESAVAVATVTLHALARYPIRLAGEDPSDETPFPR